MRIEPLFVIQGREVPAHPVTGQLEHEVITAIGVGVQAEYQHLSQEKIAQLECPEHHQHAVVSVSVLTLAQDEEAFEGSYAIEACCPQFQQTVADYLSLG